MPPSAPNPDGRDDAQDHFTFNRVGIRVPTIAVSPWTAKGSVIEAPTTGRDAAGQACTATYNTLCASDAVYEHSSIPKTLHALFAPEAPALTKRETFAAAFHEAVATLETPRVDCPMKLPEVPSHREVTPLPALDGRMPVSELQVELAAVAAGAAGRDAATAMREIEALEDEDAIARYTAGLVNEAAGAEVVPLPPARPAGGLAASA